MAVIKAIRSDDQPWQIKSADQSRSRVAPVNRRAARAQVRAAEPSFDFEVFLKRFEVAFTQIQNSWQDQDMQTVRHFVSDGVFERFSLQIEEQRQFGYRDQISDLTIDSRDLAEFTQDDAFDILTVVVTATAVDFRVSIDTGQYVSGNRDPDTFTELWTFVRRRGTAERSGNGLIEGNCPNCGSSIELNQADQCGSVRILQSTYPQR
jgi:predicted lipid-binding transport protein (Tim44 family)